MKYAIRSRLMRKLERRSKKNLILTFFGTLLIVFAVFKIGIPALVQFSLFIQNFNTNLSESSPIGVTFIQPPKLNPLPEATNSATIAINGLGVGEKEVEIFVGDELVGQVAVNKEGAFEIQSLKLKEGENVIRARVKDGDKRSDFSGTLTVIYDNKPALLEIGSPTDNESFSKDQGRVVVGGKTEPGARVTVNDFRAIVDSQGNFSYTFELSPGKNKISVKAMDLAGNQTEVDRTVTFSP